MVASTRSTMSDLSEAEDGSAASVTTVEERDGVSEEEKPLRMKRRFSVLQHAIQKKPSKKSCKDSFVRGGKLSPRQRQNKRIQERQRRADLGKAYIDLAKALNFPKKFKKAELVAAATEMILLQRQAMSSAPFIEPALYNSSATKGLNTLSHPTAYPFVLSQFCNAPPGWIYSLPSLR